MKIILKKSHSLILRSALLAAAVGLLAGLGGCAPKEQTEPQGTQGQNYPDATSIELYDNGVLVDGTAAPSGPDAESAVYVDNDIIFYLAGQGMYYGEGTEADEHTQEEADSHTVVHITHPGAYRITGTLSAGQIFVDLGEDAEEDPAAVVTLILDNASVTCTVAPAVLFYSVYECSDAEEDTGGVTDTAAAGANVLIADGTENNINGSYVARIYKSYELAEDGVTIADNKKLHKYDGAFYSKMSMNISGDGLGTGVLNINAENEGLDSELHLTINSGVINITAQNDGINTNEDYISVTTINGGTLNVNAGLGQEGDGIDSNGYLTINGGAVTATANGRSGDGGIDADCDIFLNGGTIIALGSRNDAVSSSSRQLYIELSFASTQKEGSVLALTDESGAALVQHTAQRDYQSVTISTPDLAQDTVYHLTVDGVPQQYTGNQSMGRPGGMGGFRPGGQMPGGMVPPEDFDPGQGGQPPELPEGMAWPQDGQRPQRPGGGQPPQMPEGMEPPEGGFGGGSAGEGETDFILTDTIRSFSGISASDEAGKIRVMFAVASSQEDPGITFTTEDGSEGPAEDMVQVTVTDLPSEDYAKTCLLSDGWEAIQAILPEEEGAYQLTVAVKAEDETYTGTAQWPFIISSPADNTAG